MHSEAQLFALQLFALHTPGTAMVRFATASEKPRRPKATNVTVSRCTRRRYPGTGTPGPTVVTRVPGYPGYRYPGHSTRVLVPRPGTRSLRLSRV
eukprot:2670698-Rhodomonas_salina.3